MLKYMPIYGSILLTIIIVWIVASTIIGNRRKIRAALLGTFDRSTCCGATTTPLGWTADGWTSRCDACGEWQYLGDDHNNPPSGFQADGRPLPTLILSVDDQISPALNRVAESIRRAINPAEVTSEITPYPHDCTCHPDDRPAICQRLFAASACVAAYRERYPEIAAMWEEGEPVVTPPLPNIGGEGHPDYAGPHYNVPHDRFVPYDLLRDPEPGTAVHAAGDVAFAGPLPEEGKDDAEDDHRSS